MYKTKFSLIVILLIISSFVITAKAASVETFMLTDAVTDIEYRLEIHEDYIEISDPVKTYPRIITTNTLTCSVIDGMFTFYSLDSANNILNIYRYSVANGSNEIYSVNCNNPLANKNYYTADIEGNIFFVSKSSVTELCVFSQGQISTVDMKSAVRQVLCLSDNRIAVITSKAAYIYCKGTLTEALPYPLAVPAVYSGNNKVRDAQRNTYCIDGYSLIPDTAVTETSVLDTLPTVKAHENATTRAAEPSENLAQDYGFIKITDYCYSVPQNTTVSKIKKAFAPSEILKVTKADGKIIESGKVGTAARAALNTGEEITLIIYGELTGEGNINSRDVKAILDHLCRKTLLKDEYLLAADVNSDEAITAEDALIIARMY